MIAGQPKTPTSQIKPLHTHTTHPRCAKKNKTYIKSSLDAHLQHSCVLSVYMPMAVGTLRACSRQLAARSCKHKQSKYTGRHCAGMLQGKSHNGGQTPACTAQCPGSPSCHSEQRHNGAHIYDMPCQAAGALMNVTLITRIYPAENLQQQDGPTVVMQASRTPRAVGTLFPCLSLSLFRCTRVCISQHCLWEGTYCTTSKPAQPFIPSRLTQQVSCWCDPHRLRRSHMDKHSDPFNSPKPHTPCHNQANLHSAVC